MLQRNNLENGLKLLTASFPHSSLIGINIIIKCGSRYETLETEGVSHFLEHICFAGTKKWPTKRALMTEIEKTGGIVNAETRKESTSFWIKTREIHFKKALEIIFDMVFNPRLDNFSVEKEKKVILAQINRRMDYPHQYCLDLLFKQAWPHHPLGRNTFGNKNSVSEITPEDLKIHMNQFYTPNNMIISVVGNISETKITNSVTKHFSDHYFSKGSPGILRSEDINEDQKQPQFTIIPYETRQIYLALGIKAFSNQNPARFSLQVINSLLGIGFSSRLHLSLKENGGLVFSPQTTAMLFSDTGLFVVHAQLEKGSTEEALETLIKEIVKLKKKRVGSLELKLAKEKLKGRILFSLESPEKLSEWYGSQELLQQETLTLQETFNQIDSVTPQDILEVANKLFVNKNLNLALVGPIEKNEKIAEKLTLGNS